MRDFKNNFYVIPDQDVLTVCGIYNQEASGSLNKINELDKFGDQT